MSRDIMNDEQWLAAIRECPPESNIVGVSSDGTVAIRKPDGTGITISPMGSIRWFDAQGRPCPDE